MTESEYQPVSGLALVSAGFGSLVAFAWFIPELAVLALPGVVTGLAARRQICRYEQVGRGLATAGLAFSLGLGVSATWWRVAQYHAELRWYEDEALPGYEHLDFSRLAGEDAKLKQLVGQKVCLKGYAVVPNAYRVPMSKFQFSPGGGRRPTYEALLVELARGSQWKWEDEPLAISGTLVRAEPGDEAARGKQAVSAHEAESPKFLLKDCTLRYSRSRFGLAGRDYDGC